MKTEGEIRRIETQIETWVKSQGLWGDCRFSSYLDYKNAEPWKDNPVVTIFLSEGEFNRIFEGNNGLYDEFWTMLNNHGYYFERDICRLYILSLNDQWNERFKDYFRWQWICSLLKPDFNDVHHEVFEHFAKNPDGMYKLTWREFEILIYEVLRNQGFAVDLGPGRGMMVV